MDSFIWTDMIDEDKAKITIGLFPCLLRMKVPWSSKGETSLSVSVMRMKANTQRTFTHFGFEVSVKIHRDTSSGVRHSCPTQRREGG